MFGIDPIYMGPITPLITGSGSHLAKTRIVRCMVIHNSNRHYNNKFGEEPAIAPYKVIVCFV